MAKKWDDFMWWAEGLIPEWLAYTFAALLSAVIVLGGGYPIAVYLYHGLLQQP